ncbi:hypothetical protein B0181_03400 [Moraxella caviae]|uniref:Lipoprotein n=1 Tax=Moraxella caviae TaxID=34060 RepID=A0A1T0A7R3_9GAMM|nr:hypothetical protein [Moraxella caviae]OOR91361.1 hypothetical protein B0181_03400 [Moraxella caviae]STZ13974.1 Uncharacterised protein [Moraxella caviae]VEW11491.1 Uncharacterised protein [Moraxella caviae]VEW12986.1 Uncharacterised protein [Moraxella caviae]
MKKIALLAAAAVALAGCNAMTKTADKVFYKQSNFSQLEDTQYPVGEGPEFDADVKAQAALEDMQRTQAAEAQYPAGVKQKIAQPVAEEAAVEAVEEAATDAAEAVAEAAQ